MLGCAVHYAAELSVAHFQAKNALARRAFLPSMCWTFTAGINAFVHYTYFHATAWARIASEAYSQQQTLTPDWALVSSCPCAIDPDENCCLPQFKPMSAVCIVGIWDLL